MVTPVPLTFLHGQVLPPYIFNIADGLRTIQGIVDQSKKANGLILFSLLVAPTLFNRVTFDNFILFVSNCNLYFMVKWFCM